MHLLLGAADSSHAVVFELMVILAAAAGVTMLLRRLHLAAIPGYLITGALLGLIGAQLNIPTSDENIASISNLAIILLMFTIGLHLDLDGIRTGLMHILLVGVASTTGVVLTMWPLAMLFGLPAPAAIAVGMALSMSSTAVVFRILQQRREMNTAHGRVCFAVLVVQDLMALVFLALMPPLADWSGVGLSGMVAEVEQATKGSKALALLAAGAAGIGGIALMIAVGRYVLPRLLTEAARESSAETPLVLAAAVALGAAIVTSALGFSPELGAFLAGFLLASTPFKHQLAGQLAPMRDLFMAVFFTAVGLKLDLGVIAGYWWVIAIGLVLMLSVKAVLIALSTWAAGSTVPTAVASGFALAEAGEFSLVLLAAAASEDHPIISGDVQAVAISMVVVSLVLTPGLYNAGQKLRPRFMKWKTAGWFASPALRDETHGAAVRAKREGSLTTPAGKPLSHHVIIAGFGIVGRNMAQHFEVAGINYLIVELNPATVRKQRALGRSIVFGDISNPEVLQSAGIECANAVVLTVPDDDATLLACRAIRAAAPTIFIAARTSYLSRAIRATELGADHVVVEEIATAEAMSKQVLHRIFQHLQNQPGAWIPGASAEP
ncbi:MAG: cation:proton antiporter [Phycisphaerales bacterium]|nr:cation:proton antiporter [Phycisphaerales bacterium]